MCSSILSLFSFFFYFSSSFFVSTFSLFFHCCGFFPPQEKCKMFQIPVQNLDNIRKARKKVKDILVDLGRDSCRELLKVKHLKECKPIWNVNSWQIFHFLVYIWCSSVIDLFGVFLTLGVAHYWLAKPRAEI